jgi:hypothetical protein
MAVVPPVPVAPTVEPPNAVEFVVVPAVPPPEPDSPAVLLEQAKPATAPPVITTSKIPLLNQDTLNSHVFMRKTLPAQ